MSVSQAYIIAARRAANGRIGGIHRTRRLEDLAAPILAETIADSQIPAAEVELILLGNTTGVANPARLIALMAGLGDQTQAMTIDRQSASGLEAILMALGRIGSGEVEVAVAGGAEALSMAPWRIARPRTIAQTPRFIGLGMDDSNAGDGIGGIEAADALARRLSITRRQQDEYAIASHIRAGLALGSRHFAKEIVALRPKPEEARDELLTEPDIDDLEGFPPLATESSLTAGNSSRPADGAAFILAVSEARYEKLGRPPALRLVDMASLGVAPTEDVMAPLAAGRRLAERLGVADLGGLASVELAEATAVQAMAVRDGLGLTDQTLNRDGGQVARGQPIAASSAVLVVRLFSRMARAADRQAGLQGAVIAGASGGQGLAAAFVAV